MAYFSDDFLRFFIELASNNHKEWFDANRKRYESTVKKPFEVFVTDLIAVIKKHDPEMDITYKDAIFRINRDIRFSKDKQPYKLNRSAIVSSKGKKDKAFPGLYFEMGPEHFRIYGGVYAPDKEQLYAIRETIAKNPQVLDELLKAPDFVAAYGEVLGEQNKVLPAEFKAAAIDQPLIYNKQFYWYKTFDAEQILEDDLMILTESYYLANKKIMDYFAKAMML